MASVTIKNLLGPAARVRLRAAQRYLRARLDRPRWLKPATIGPDAKVCLLACHAGSNGVAQHVLDLARAWNTYGFEVVLVIACDHPSTSTLDATNSDHLAGILVRANVGYDFGSWRAALHALPAAKSASLLALTNASVYGPFSTFERMLQRVQASTADIVGLTDSFEFVHHLQSYLVFYKRDALCSHAFARFWRPVRWGDRGQTILKDELPFLFTMQIAGLRAEILYPARRQPVENPTLLRWKELVADGFPFVKAQLLRSNDFGADIGGWDEILKTHGYDPSKVVSDLGAMFTKSAACKAVSATIANSLTTTGPEQDRTL